MQFDKIVKRCGKKVPLIGSARKYLAFFKTYPVGQVFLEGARDLEVLEDLGFPLDVGVKAVVVLHFGLDA